MEASAESRKLTILGSTTKVLTDVLVGDVWLGSGQSNMVINVKGAGFPKTYDRTTPRPLIRYSRLPNKEENKALKQAKASYLWNPEWLAATPENIPKIGGTLFAFADQLQQELQIPIGIVNRAVGGTPVRHFVDQQLFVNDPEVMAKIKEVNDNFQRDSERALIHAELWKEFTKIYSKKQRDEMRFLRAPGLAGGRIGTARLGGKGIGYVQTLSNERLAIRRDHQ